MRGRQILIVSMFVISFFVIFTSSLAQASIFNHYSKINRLVRVGTGSITLEKAIVRVTGKEGYVGASGIYNLIADQLNTNRITDVVSQINSESSAIDIWKLLNDSEQAVFLEITARMEPRSSKSEYTESAKNLAQAFFKAIYGEQFTQDLVPQFPFACKGTAAVEDIEAVLEASGTSLEKVATTAEGEWENDYVFARAIAEEYLEAESKKEYPSKTEAAIEGGLDTLKDSNLVVVEPADKSMGIITDPENKNFAFGYVDSETNTIYVAKGLMDYLIQIGKKDLIAAFLGYEAAKLWAQEQGINPQQAQEMAERVELLLAGEGTVGNSALDDEINFLNKRAPLARAVGNLTTLEELEKILGVGLPMSPLSDTNWQELGAVVGRDLEVWVRDTGQYPQEPYFIRGINNEVSEEIEKVTYTEIKGDMGSVSGHTKAPGAMIERVAVELFKAMKEGLIISFAVTAVGDDIHIIMTHTKGDLNPEIHNLGQRAMKKAIVVAEEINAYGAGQDMRTDAEVGNVAGAGLGVAEMTFTIRKGETVTSFMGDKLSTASFGPPMFRLLTDPSVNPTLLAKPAAIEGYTAEIWNVYKKTRIFKNTLHDKPVIHGLVYPMHDWVFKRIFPLKVSGLPTDEPMAVLSTTVLALVEEELTGEREYIGKDDPAMVIRSQGAFPPQGSLTEAFNRLTFGTGWMMGGQSAPIYPVGLKDAIIGAFDGPSLIAGISFQIDRFGRLVGPHDQFASSGFDRIRREVLEEVARMRQLDQFIPAALTPNYLEYGIPPKGVAEQVEEEAEPIPEEELASVEG